MNWKKYIVFSISAACFLVFAKYAYSCIAELVYYDYPSFFGNKTPGKVAYRPFFYVDGDLYYNNREDRNQDGTDLLNDANLKEWQSFAGLSIPLGDIDSIINKCAVKDLINISKHKNNNAFAQWLAGNKSNGAVDYLVYAKQCEPYVVSTGWDTLTVNTDSSEILIKKGSDACSKAKVDFIRTRYAFQVLRLAFYNKQNDRTLQLYNKLIDDAQPQSLTFARCIGFKAGVNFRQGNYAQAAYLYSKMFDASDGLKRTAMISFVWSVDNNDSIKDVVASALGLCKNNHERAVITVMQALREFGEALPLIQKAYELDPAVEGIDVLVNREINKIEERYQTHNLNKENGIAYDGYRRYFEGQPDDQQARLNDSVRNAYPAYLNKLNAFIQRLVVEKKNSHAAYWYLSSAYIQYMLHNTAQMDAAMQLANQSNMNNQEQQLYQVMLILYSIQNHPSITPTLEAEWLPQLRALEKLANEDDDEDQNFSNIMNYLLAPKYLQQKDTTKALYCMAHSQREGNVYANTGYWWRYRSAGDSATYAVDAAFQDRPGVILDRMGIDGLHGVQAFEANNNKTPFEAWLVSNTYYDKNTLAELEGTKYVRTYNFKAAEKAFADIPNLDRLPFPFEMRINDYEDTVYRQDTAVLNNKYTFAKQMASLQDTIAKNPNNAPALYKYALGLYGMSYYGRSPHLFTYYHGSTDEFKYYKTKERDMLPDVFQEYYGLYTAENYFNLAAKAATTATLKAKCMVGAAKCWQKRCTSRNDDADPDLSYVSYSLSNPYFKILKRDYGTNEFTKEIYNTCSYYKDYVKKNE